MKSEKRKSLGPLDGVRVVDLTHVMAGPTCTLMLADMGADVVKIESPKGDDTRGALPQVEGQSSAFMMMNRNKRGIVLNLKKSAGISALRRLIQTADILVENYAPGVLEQFGLGYDQLKEEFPSLIYCSLSGFGKTGPYKSRRGFDLIAQAMSGIMSFTGDGEDSPPAKCGPPLSDISAGLLGTIGVLAAYSHRLKTGMGQLVDTSLFEAALVQTYWQSAITLMTGEIPRALGSSHPLMAPYQAFEARDGWFVIGGANQRNWLRLVKAIGAPELGDDERFRENAGRMAHLPALRDELEKRFRLKPVSDWLRVFDEAGLPCGPVFNMKQALEDEQTVARDMVVKFDHPTAGVVRTLGLPIKFSQTPGGVRRAAPLLGQHSKEVLAELGFSADEIQALHDDGAVISQ